MSKRVQIPAYTDAWMQGDRYGEIVNIRFASPGKGAPRTNIADVKLDVSKKIRRFILDDCQEV